MGARGSGCANKLLLMRVEVIQKQTQVVMMILSRSIKMGSGRLPEFTNSSGTTSLSVMRAALQPAVHSKLFWVRSFCGSDGSSSMAVPALAVLVTEASVRLGP